MRPTDRLRCLVRMPPHAESIRADVDAEIAFHLEQTERELVARGMSVEDARHEAKRRFGDVEHVRASLGALDGDAARRTSSGDFWSGWWQDLTRSARQLRREPGFAGVVALTLALGIGANATMFRVLDRVVLRPAPHVRNDGSLSLLYFQQETPEFGRVTNTSQSFPAYESMRRGFQPMGDLAAWWVTSVSSGTGPTARNLEVSFVTPNLFDLLGARPWTGRLFDVGAWEAEAVPTVVLTHAFASANFGAPSSSIGRSVTIGQRAHIVIGVTPPGFVGADLRPVDLFVTMPTAVADRIGESWRTKVNSRWLQVVARRDSGVTPEQAGAAITGALQNFGRANAKGDSVVAVIAGSIVRARRPGGTPTARIALWLGGVALLVLLVACANVANLLLARATRRRRELAVHLALGVSRARLMRALISETVLMGLLAGGLALLLSSWGDDLLRATLLRDLPLDSDAVDFRQSIFVLLAVLFAILTAGLVPAVIASRTAVLEALRSGARDGGGRRHSLRTALVVAQGTLSVILMIGAGLFVRSFSRAANAELGFEASGLIVATPDLSVIARSPEDFESRWRRVQDAVGRIPGVESAAQSVTIPFESQWMYSVLLNGDTLQPLSGGGPYLNGVSAEYFRTMQTRLVRGREFTEADRQGSLPVAIVNERMAERVWQGRDPIGQCFGIQSFEGCVTVVGIVANTRMTELTDDAPAHYYVPIGQWQPNMRTLFVRIGAESGIGETDVRQAILAAEPSLPYVEVRPAAQIVDQQLRSWTLGATMFTLFGLLGLAVAALGLYSVVSHDVSQRSHEIGVRMALGASQGDVARLVVGSGVRQALAGVAIGMTVSWVVSARIADLLYETSPHDAQIYGGVLALLLLVALAASLLPARRAARVHPVEVLRD